MKTISADQFTHWSRSIKKSDQTAFKALFDQTHDALLYFALRYIPTQDTAQDILQEVYIKLWDMRTKIDPDKSLKSLMYQMVRNMCLTHIRDHKRTQIGIDDLPEPSQEDKEPVIFEEYAENLEALIHGWISELPDRQREAFELSRFDGLTHEEISSVMDLQPRTVNNHIVLALKFLKSKLDTYRHQQKDS